MPKWKNSYDSGRRCKPVSEKEFPWIEKKKHKTSQEAYSKICQKTVAPPKSPKSQHASTNWTKEHKQKLFTQSHSFKFVNVFWPQPKISDSVHKTELELAVCIICHTSLLGKITLAKSFKKFKVETMLEKFICIEQYVIAFLIMW